MSGIQKSNGPAKQKPGVKKKLLKRFHLVKASDVTPEAIEWLWDGYLATGKLHLFGGAPGTGKTRELYT